MKYTFLLFLIIIAACNKPISNKENNTSRLDTAAFQLPEIGRAHV